MKHVTPGSTIKAKVSSEVDFSEFTFWIAHERKHREGEREIKTEEASLSIVSHKMNHTLLGRDTLSGKRAAHQTSGEGRYSCNYIQEE